ncbi:hypothetical protein PACTADRAFT_16446 [Pachysolen tannophilus NRRL Y-2460]|uniref:prephenate dehydratase n=1 Tax=Pachysolen tannophilus NRRL Y-2460 TaxID=669874 RepID=A0A1E4TX51_PACTA|nr:hypothetical protein PACTADRAFT_16446 [Pachysolen tannophilus NRRL Y-2460]
MVKPILRVVYLGPAGTYTYEAARQQFDVISEEEYEVIYTASPSIARCFEIINNKECDYAVIPFENSSNGQVVFTYDLFRDWFCKQSKHQQQALQNQQQQIQLPSPGLTQPSSSSSFSSSSSASFNSTRLAQSKGVPSFGVVGEQFVSIHHYFLTYAKRLSDIKTIYSHPQVWTQCNNFLANPNFSNNLEKIDVSSTSRSAEIVSKLSLSERNSVAAIASFSASQMYNIPILFKKIEDNSTNTTRFLILGYNDIPQSKTNVNDLGNSKKLSNKKITLLSFILKSSYNDHGSLCNTLNCFTSRNLNLLSITTRPSNLTPWLYMFFIEILTCNDADSTSLNDALDEIDSFVLEKSIIGKEFERDAAFYTSGNT